MTGHKDSVEVLPTGATLLADGQTCPAQLFRFGDHVWASQFHPEMDDAAIRTRLSFYENAGYCDPDELAETYARLQGNDTSHANSLLRRFVEYCREGTDSVVRGSAVTEKQPLPRGEAIAG